MINSWGSFPAKGFLDGATTDFGSYDQCLDIEPNSIIDNSQYCLIDLIPPIPRPMPVHHNLHHHINVLPIENNNNEVSKNVLEFYSEFASFFYWISMRTGVCTPSKCNSNDISSLAKGFADNYGLELKQSRCEIKSKQTTITAIQVIAMLFVSSVLMISLMATLLDTYFIDANSGKTSLLIDMFSMRRNLNSLLDKTSSDMFHCIHGIRVLSMVWIVLCHSTEWNSFQVYSGAFRVKYIFARLEVQMIMNGEYAVDTFFLIGGILTSYMTFQYSQGRLSRFNLIGYIFARFLRLTPQTMIFILLTFLLPLGGWASGPIWKETINPIIDNCSTNWWWNLLYIQNWLKETEICGVHTWFLACDMQYHLISLILIIPLLYKLKLGLLFTGISIVIFYITSMIISYSYDLPPGMVNTGRDEHLMEYYVGLFFRKPWAHSTVFFIGFWLGIVLYRKQFIKLTKKTEFCVFTLIITGYIICLLDTYYWNTGKSYNRLLSSIIFSTCRLIWSVSTATLIWMCISGNGGIINAFLSASIFTPFSRLTYSVYLTHVWNIWIFSASRRHLIDTNLMDIFYIFVHNLIVAYFAGFLFALLIEAPIFKLQKHFLNKYLETEENCNNNVPLDIKLSPLISNKNEL